MRTGTIPIAVVSEQVSGPGSARSTWRRHLDPRHVS